jgi:periplasmic protein CpxP/Spy
MSTKTKSRLLLVIIGILLITNIILLFLVFNNKGRGRFGGPGSGKREAMMKAFLQKEIGFNPQQLQQYDSFSRQHQDKMKAQFDQMRSDKAASFKSLSAGDFSDSIINSISMLSAEKQKTMEIQMLLHIRSVRAICNAAQLPKFDSLFPKIMLNRKR